MGRNCLLFILMCAPTGLFAQRYTVGDRAEKLRRLTPLQREVIDREGTEPAFDNLYWNNKERGIYVDQLSGEPLFSSEDKYDSGTGWPSFTKPIDPAFIVTRDDYRLFSKRTEVRSRYGDAHLGHVFDDGPPPTGLRYCMNSAALRFVPLAQMAAEGYGDYLSLFPGAAEGAAEPATFPLQDGYETAIFGAGCFWCTEADFDKVEGVVETISGFDGGTSPNPSYREVSKGGTPYVEVVKISYDPAKVSYRQLLQHYWLNVDPTVPNQQFCDVGSQYRSVIFYLNDQQRREADESLAEVKRLFDRVYTTVEPSSNFSPAEGYHQDYYLEHPLRYKYYRTSCGRDRRLKQLWGDKKDAPLFADGPTISKV